MQIPLLHQFLLQKFSRGISQIGHETGERPFPHRPLSRTTFWACTYQSCPADGDRQDVGHVQIELVV